MIAGKSSLNVLKTYKNSFYQKSLVLRTDFSNYRKHFKLWHARYFDIARRTEYENKVRDYRKLRFNTGDPLHFDYEMKNISGDFHSVKKLFNFSLILTA